MQTEENALDAGDVAQLLGVSRNTVYNLVKQGGLASYSVGRKMRFTLADVDAYISGKRTGGSLANSDVPQPATFRIAGSDLAADITANYLGQAGLNVGRSYVTCHAALWDLYYGNAEAAVVSLYDRKTGKWNVPYVQRLAPGTSVVVQKLLTRRVGLLVAKGNPKGIRSWRDLLRDGVSVANAQRGSSLRVLLDEQMVALDAGVARPAGHVREFASSLVAASFVQQGGADCALADERTYHQVEGLDFLPLATAEIDLVVVRNDATKPALRFLRDVLKTRAFRTEVAATTGSDASRVGEVVYQV